jgi:V8-like Glu-specific endopeptidase
MDNEYLFSPSKLDKIYYRITSNDNRSKVLTEKLSSVPYSSIGLLKMVYPHDVVSYRTGVLIGENIVLTAGHNLYDPRNNPNSPTELLGSPESIEFYPGLTENKTSFEKCTGKNIYFPKNYPKTDGEDYGIIILNENIGKKTGYFNLKIFDEEEDRNNVFYNCGYPLNRTTNNNTVFYQYEAKGHLLKVNEKKGVIVSGIQSSYGQSGAGLFFIKDNKYYVIGVHVASSFDDTLFYATMINKKRYEQIQKWINESQNK